MTAPPLIPLAATATPRGLGVCLELLRYFLASAAALGVDVGLFAGCTRAGLPYQMAASIGFIVGALVAYIASVRWVFDARSMRNAGVEFGIFVAIGVGGLAITEILLWLFIERFGMAAVTAKLGAAAFVFAFNFAVRKAILFRAEPR